MKFGERFPNALENAIHPTQIGVHFYIVLGAEL